jgi:hypothetical protein
MKVPKLMVVSNGTGYDTHLFIDGKPLLLPVEKVVITIEAAESARATLTVPNVEVKFETDAFDVTRAESKTIER